MLSNHENKVAYCKKKYHQKKKKKKKRHRIFFPNKINMIKEATYTYFLYVICHRQSSNEQIPINRFFIGLCCWKKIELEKRYFHTFKENEKLHHMVAMKTIVAIVATYVYQLKRLEKCGAMIIYIFVLSKIMSSLY